MLSIIVATAENNVIGHLNKIPWYMPRDLKHFADTTRGHTVIMGRNTYDSIVTRLGKPLPDRTNIVVTRQTNFSAPHCVIVHSLTDALKKIDADKENFIIGGSQLYTEALSIANRIYRTFIHTTLEGDAFFPAIDHAHWKKISATKIAKDEKNPFDATFEVYEKI